MFGSCWCGAVDCSICGPMQGYSQCDVCLQYECEDEEECEADRVDGVVPFDYDEWRSDNWREEDRFSE